MIIKNDIEENLIYFKGREFLFYLVILQYFFFLINFNFFYYSSSYLVLKYKMTTKVVGESNIYIYIYIIFFSYIFYFTFILLNVILSGFYISIYDFTKLL